MKTLYISDLDGTLLNSKAELSEYTIKTLNRFIEKGGHFSIATARTAETALKICESVKFNEPIVLMNGAFVYNPAVKRYIKKESFSDTIKEEVLEATRRTELTGLMYTLENEKLTTYYETLGNTAIRNFVNERITKYNKEFIRTKNFSDITSETIFFSFLDTNDKIDKLYKLLSKISGISVIKMHDTYSENLWYLEIYSITASKHNAAHFLRNQGGYDKIIGFGDNLNDIPLARACDEFYAVENAKNELKEIATATIETNENDGVAKWLEKNM